MEARKLSNQSPPFQLSLRIRHPSIDPALLSRELAIDPEHSFRAGEPRRSSSGHAPSTVHGQTYWLGILNPAMWRDISFPGRPKLAIAQQASACGTGAAPGLGTVIRVPCSCAASTLLCCAPGSVPRAAR